MGLRSADSRVAKNQSPSKSGRWARLKDERLRASQAATARRLLGSFEALEDRVLFSVSQDANGWTVVTPDANSRVIYVSTSGSDSNNGLSPSAPVATLSHAASLVRSGMPDQILLQAGDIWHGQSFSDWTASGQDANDPMLVSYYGSGALPVVDPGNNYAGFTVNGTYGGTSTVSFLDVIGIKFYAQNRDPNSSSVALSESGCVSGFQDWAPGQNILLEDDQFSFFHNNIDIEAINGFQTAMTVRRSVSDYSWDSAAHSQGLYSNMTNDLSILQCTFDHNGWNTQIAGAGQQGYNHDIYYSYDTSDVTVQGCILADSSFAGIMARSGGNIDYNVFVNDTNAVTYGLAGGADSTPGGVTGSLIGNVIVGDKSLAGLAYGQGFDLGNISPAGVVISNNIFTNDSQHAKPAIYLDYANTTYNASVTVGLNNLTVTDNIINGWWVGIETNGAITPGSTGQLAENNVSITDNQIVNSTTREFRHDSVIDPTYETIAGNEYYDTNLAQSQWQSLQGNTLSISQWIAGYEPTAKILPYLPYVAPGRTADTYDASIGDIGTEAAWAANADLLTIQNYQPQYMAAALISYIEAGFSTNTTAPTATAAVPSVGASGIGSSLYTFSVTYLDGFGMNASSFASTNLLVAGPNGFTANATYTGSAVSTTTAGGYQSTVVTYDFVAPGGAWAQGDDGTYTVSVLPNQVSDSSGIAVPAGVLAVFNADFTPPTAIATVTPINTVPSGAYSFTITYADASGIDPTSLDSSEVHATGPANYSEYATLGATTTATNAAGQQTLIATYTLNGPNGSWFNASSGTYTIAINGGDVADTFGNTVTAGTLATFTVNVGGGGTVAASPVGSVSGVAFDDANGDGILDGRELPMVGVTIFIDLAGTGIYSAADPVAVTDSTGSFTLSGLAAGNYAVIEQDPAGFTAPNQTVAVAANQAVSGVYFANVLGTAIVNGSNSSGGTTTGTTTTTGSNSSTGTTATGSNTSTGTTTTKASGSNTSTGIATGANLSTGKITTGSNTSTGTITTGSNSSTGKTTTGANSSTGATTTGSNSSTGKTTTGSNSSNGTTTAGSNSSAGRTTTGSNSSAGTTTSTVSKVGTGGASGISVKSSPAPVPTRAVPAPAPVSSSGSQSGKNGQSSTGSRSVGSALPVK